MFDINKRSPANWPKPIARAYNKMENKIDEALYKTGSESQRTIELNQDILLTGTVKSTWEVL